ncbi:hybrid sensor histidine kinase/response regulator transcription factor [Dyadobacter psychrotolerans]|uniref:histidine kinase n=1 Tax=Dyadobacter psychrotolerans TaxID=2541721 RepID=A0A4R5DKS8_9BACT|nr:hybrid sensor histidine kinase/response regulator transcription factor [Dyadobacter psychrotolerans]TDE14669.1 hybrid sensor histidine kinase/response regulator [Dyadobacter psychrotolerans]
MRYCSLVYLSVFLSNFIFAQSGNVRFLHIGINEGLSQSTVRYVFQDKKGFIWFGTKDGLNKYDGYKVIVYKKDIRDKNSLSSNDIKCISEDSEGKLWIATWEGGVNVFDPKLEKFAHYRKGNPTDPQSLTSDYIECIYVDRQDNVWIGTELEGLDIYDRKKKRFFHYAHNRSKPNGLTGNNISAINQDKNQDIWIGTTTGLNLFDKKTNTFKPFLHEQNRQNASPYNNIKFIFEDSRKNFWVGTYGGGLSQLDRKTGVLKSVSMDGLSNDVLLSVTEDNQGNLWLGTENDGLIIFNPPTGKLTKYHYDDGDQTTISSNTVNSVLKDAMGNIWLGTLNGGVNLINTSAGKFSHYRHQQGRNSLSNNIVNYIFEDSKDLLWIGTDGGGLDRLDRKTGLFKNYRHIAGNPNSISGNYVLSVAEDASHDLWVGTWGEGVTVFNPEKNSYRHYRHDPSDSKTIGSNYAFFIFKDSQNQIWIGTYGAGLERYNPQTDSFIHYAHDPKNPNSLASNNILSITEDNNANLIIGTDGGGLNILDTKTGSFVSYKHSEDPNSLSNNSVSSVWIDKNKNIWAGTNYGLNKLDRKTGKITHLFSADGLPNDVITGLLSDDRNLWISTTRGLAKYDFGKKSFENFTLTDGIQGYEFKGTGTWSRNGLMYLGGFRGFNEFNPKQTKTERRDPSIVFTGFQIFNKQAAVSKEGSPLKESINSVKEIILSYAESVITFEFAALNYVNKEKIQYAYILEGFDKQWNRIGAKNNVTYTNLDPGSYTFKVKTVWDKTDSSGKIAEVKIVVTPPFWKTWWFRLLMLLAITGAILYIFYRRVASIEQRNRLLEEVVAKRTFELKEANQDLESSNHTKDRFFSILAHDLKNPVAALSGISDLLKEKFPQLSSEDVYSYISDINKSSNSIQDLLINLLDWARTQTNNIVYTPSNLNLYELVVKNQLLIEQQIKRKGIRFSVQVNPLHTIFADPQMIDTIIRNLLSNSIKFTASSGQISIQSHEEEEKIQILFKDNGIGMSAQQAKNLFDTKKTSIANGTEGETGTGLGLVIVKEFIEANQGSLEVTSTPMQGTIFTIALPKANATVAANKSALAFEKDEKPANQNGSESLSLEKLEALRGKRILIVDDNSEIRSFLKLLLSDIFEVSEATNGAEGIEQATRSQPDVIISDMIMPVMNGLEFCQTIKTEANTSHIPVILLTSQANDQSQLSGYEAGADSYLLKPIRQHLLFQVIYNFIRSQENIRQKFEQSEDIYPSDLEFNKPDKEFLDKIVAFVEENLSDPELDHKKIGELTSLSRTVLYAKFKSLTGQGVHDFIKSIRLKKSLKLLQEGRLNINQIAYEVGFNTPSYFSKSFIKQYGVSPSEYLAKLKNASQS